MKWNANEFSESCEFIATSAEKCVHKIDRISNKSPADKDAYDEHNAKFCVYYHFVNRSILTTKEQCLAETDRLRKQGPIFPTITIYDRERFKMWWDMYLTQLVKMAKNKAN